jgi:16S rRNA (guanine527-N7)-methyltransferase
MTSSDDRTTVVASAPAEMRRRLHDLRDLLLRWNERFNLTALRNPDDIDEKLIGDALLMLPPLDEVVMPIAARQSERVTLIDIGTGAGFPGLVLKIARPELDVTLVDATGKKIQFVEAAIAELGLSHARAIHGRAEELARLPHHREIYDIVTARAVAALPTLLELTLPFLRLGGTGLYPKGMEIDQELAEAGPAAEELGGRLIDEVRLPLGSGQTRTRLVRVSKILSTSHRYPRRSGVPAKDPLGRAGR